MNVEYAIDYNGQTYEQIVGIIRYSDDGTVIQDEVLNNDSIEVLSFKSDMRVPYLTGMVAYRDRSVEGIQNSLQDGYTHLVVTLTHYDGYDILETISHIFVVTNIKLIDKEEYLFQFDMKSIYWFLFNNFEEYASIDKGEKYTKMVKDITSSIGFGNRISHVEETNNIGDFSSTVNSTTYETIDELLDLSANEDQGFFYLQYDFTVDKFNIHSIKSIYDYLDDVSKSSNYYILMTDEHKNSSDQASMWNFVSESEFSFKDYINALKEFRTHSFSYDDKGWTSKSYGINNIQTFMPPIADPKLFKRFVKPLPNLYNDRVVVQQELDSIDNSSYLKQLRDLFLYTNYSVVTSAGHLYRKGGDLGLVDAMDESPLRDKYAGLWFIIRVNHVFDGKEKIYSNIIEVSRAEYLKDLDKVKVTKDTESFAGLGGESDFSTTA